MNKVLVVLPSLDPDDNLKRVVDDLISEGFENILIVNDGSKKECLHHFEELKKYTQCTVLDHDINRGKGVALKTAFKYYLDNYVNNGQSDFKGVITADADGQHLASDIKKSTEAMFNDENSVIFGVRDFNVDSVPIKSRVGNQTTTKIIKLLFGKLITDTQTGLRAIPNKYIDLFLKEKGDRFEYEINMLIYALNSNINIEQVPIETVYFENNRETHFHAIKDSLKIYGVILSSFIRYMCSSVVCFIVDQGLFSILIGIFKFVGNYSIFLATVLSRIFSAVLNYNINKKLVFNSDEKSASYKYAFLCCVQMMASALFVTLISKFNNLTNINIIKVFVDIGLFFVSYLIQKLWVFRRK